MTILPSWTISGLKIAPGDRVTMGFIGLGQQGINDFVCFSSVPGVQVVAGCDVDSINCDAQKAKEAGHCYIDQPLLCVDIPN